MKQQAKVVSVDGDRAVIKVERASMCDGCHKKGCADSCSLYKIFGANTSFEAPALNRAGAAVGDVVTVETESSTVTISAFFVFILPLIVVFAAYMLTEHFYSEKIGIAAALISFVLYFGVLAVIDRITRAKQPQLVIVKIGFDMPFDCENNE